MKKLGILLDKCGQIWASSAAHFGTRATLNFLQKNEFQSNTVKHSQTLKH